MEIYSILFYLAVASRQRHFKAYAVCKQCHRKNWVLNLAKAKIAVVSMRHNFFFFTFLRLVNKNLKKQFPGIDLISKRILPSINERLTPMRQ